METEFGARLDSLADEGTLILAFVGLLVFKWGEFEPYKISALLFLASYILSILISLIRFKKMPSLHLYSSKVGAVLQGSFFFVLFIFGFYPVFYYIVVILGIAAFIEQIIILLISSEMKPNSKGLYWVLKNQ